MNNQRGSKVYFRLKKTKFYLVLTENNLTPMAAKQAEDDITLLVQQILE